METERQAEKAPWWMELGAAERMFSRTGRGGGAPTSVIPADSDWVPSKHLIHE